ncbi:DNA-binding transcriptional MerR regulator [Murinocardiopsis flavida]|uniref:DNA-binding transcriptional MerR regulator n=1 Tax=Murinocardiopsis flavida TaxID=645275 RepID=A0A2P8DIH2_9ACTN|nr:MerR family transcriptional regulator [Murinocardiopsis flavida]PSK97027.1 DNA-binding transcriptional MerR regulator [Murinocardiopsis flavida]
MRIGELSRRTGVSVRLLRYYEEQGLLRPERQPSGYREFREADVATVGRIRSLLGAGLGTAEISGVLDCFVEDCERLVPTCAEMLGDLERARERMTGMIDDLQESRRMLDAVIAAGPSEEPERAMLYRP